ncbi:hypothetical protein SUGI_1161190 [Cryptomeria japonica]|nr:hypothetical protein SUGI_1161190 [Cryptomeria japonica]
MNRYLLILVGKEVDKVSEVASKEVPSCFVPTLPPQAFGGLTKGAGLEAKICQQDSRTELPNSAEDSFGDLLKNSLAKSSKMVNMTENVAKVSGGHGNFVAPSGDQRQNFDSKSCFSSEEMQGWQKKAERLEDGWQTVKGKKAKKTRKVGGFDMTLHSHSKGRAPIK